MLKHICFAISKELWQLEPKGSKSRQESPLTDVSLPHVFSLAITPTHPRGSKDEQIVAARRPHVRQSFSYCHGFGDPALECGAHQGSRPVEHPRFVSFPTIARNADEPEIDQSSPRLKASFRSAQEQSIYKSSMATHF